MESIDDKQMHVLCHTLGLSSGATPSRRKPHRNHYVAGDGHHSMDAIVALIGLGLMEERRRPGFIPTEHRVFAATDAGRAAAVADVERRWAEVPRGKKRYLMWLRSEIPMSFGEFLRRGLYSRERYEAFYG